MEEAGEWLGRTAGGCKNNATCAQNPQFLVKVKQQTEITAVLYQSLAPLTKGSLAPDQIGFYVFKTKGPHPLENWRVVVRSQALAPVEKKLKLEKLPPADFVAKSAFSSTREGSPLQVMSSHSRIAVAKFTLSPSSLYALVPSTFDAGRDGPFSLVLFSDAPVKISELFGTLIVLGMATEPSLRLQIDRCLPCAVSGRALPPVVRPLCTLGATIRSTSSCHLVRSAAPSLSLRCVLIRLHSENRSRRRPRFS